MSDHTQRPTTFEVRLPPEPPGSNLYVYGNFAVLDPSAPYVIRQGIDIIYQYPIDPHVPVTDGNILYTVIRAPSNGTLLKDGAPTTQFTAQDLTDSRVTYNHSGAVLTDSFDIWCVITEAPGIVNPYTPAFHMRFIDNPTYSPNQGAFYFGALLLGSSIMPRQDGGDAWFGNWGTISPNINATFGTTRPNEVVFAFVTATGTKTALPYPAAVPLTSISVPGLTGWTRLGGGSFNTVNHDPIHNVTHYCTTNAEVYYTTVAAIVPTTQFSAAWAVTGQFVGPEETFINLVSYSDLADLAHPWGTDPAAVQVRVATPSSAVPGSLSLTTSASDQLVLPVLFEAVVGDYDSTQSGAVLSQPRGFGNTGGGGGGGGTIGEWEMRSQSRTDLFYATINVNIEVPVIKGDSYVLALSYDGTTVVGRADDADGVAHAVYWIYDGTNARIYDIGTLPGGSYAYANHVSADGLTIVGNADRASGVETAFRWTPQTGMVDIAASHSASSGADAVSADGNAVCGYVNFLGATDQIFLWTSSGGFTILPNPPSGWRAAQAYISPNAQHMFGFLFNPEGAGGDYNYWKWTPSGGLVDTGILNALASGGESDNPAVNDTGVGLQTGSLSDDFDNAKLWKITSAIATTDINVIDAGIPGAGGTMVTLDESTVVGYGTSGEILVAWRWTAADGVVTVIPPPDGYPLSFTTPTKGISADGTIFTATLSDVSGLFRGGVYRWCPPPVHERMALDNVLVEDASTIFSLVYRWRSRQFYMMAPASLGACHISLDPAVSIPAPKPLPVPPLNDADALMVLPPGVNAIFRLFAGPEGQNLVMTKVLDQDRMIFRLPGGLKAFCWQFEIVSRVPIFSVELASTMKELQGV